VKPEGESNLVLRAIRAAYFLFVMWIPIETVYLVKDGGESGGGITISRLLGLAIVGLALLEPRRCFRRLPAVFWMLAWYLAFFAASQLWIPSELDALFLGQLITLTQMIVLFLLSANLFADEEAFRESLLRFYGWWIGLVAAAMLIIGSSFSEGRASLASQDPNVTAGFFALGAVCLAGDPRLFAPGRSKAASVAALAVMAVLIFGILNTGSRGGLMSFGAGVLALGVCGGKESRKRKLLIAGLVSAVLALMIAREFQAGTTTSVRLDRAWNEGDTAGRTLIWDMAWAMFRERPLLGYGGVNNFFTLGSYMNFPFRNTHNLLLAVLTEVGLIGGIPFFGAMLYAMWLAWRYGERTGNAVPFALMAVAFAINQSITGKEEKLFWIVLAAAAACGPAKHVEAEARELQPIAS
jgi:O-antigen ligase